MPKTQIIFTTHHKKNTMKNFLILLFLISSLSTFSQTKVGGVELPNEMLVKENRMQLQGAGTRVKLWMDMYAMGLYLSTDINDAEQIISKDESMGIRLQIISGLITSEKMEKATRDGFKNSTNGEMAHIQSEIDEFISVFSGGIEKEDVFEFMYTTESGTMVYKNGELKDSINGLSFKQALFGIWLCKKPVDKSLKEKLLK